ncbi:MAG: DNA polymerase I [Cyanobacteria bacterium QS_8_64_29]|nr:MAG: DNA polymerase I [Cyanobacteria bacterium QS_8_64_29]
MSADAAPLLLLVDGHSLAFRAYYAFANSREGGLRNSAGTPTSICFGFLHSLLQVIEAQQPQLVAVAFDLAMPTFRHEADEAYKADREEPPDDFAPDLENLKALLAALNLQVVTAAGYEADDLLATLAHRGSNAGYRVRILTGDRDLFQLVDAERQIAVLYSDRSALRGNSEATISEVGPEAVREQLQIAPEQVVDYKALCGDKSDNVPGVEGIGPKTVVKLLQAYGDLDGIYQNLERIKGTTRTKLEAGQQAAQHSRYMVQLQADAPCELPLAAFRLQGFEASELRPLLAELELNTFLRRLDRLQQQLGGPPSADADGSASADAEDLAFFSPEETDRHQQAQAQYAPNPHIIDTPERLEALVAHLQTLTEGDSPVAWDTETTALKPRKAQLVGLGCCWGPQPDQIAYIPLGHSQGGNLDCARALEQLRPLLESREYPKALQHAKFDRLVLWHHGIALRGVTFDTLLASYLLRPETTHNLKDLVARHLPAALVPDSYQDLAIPKGQTIADLEVAAVAHYCGMDAYATFLLVPPLRDALAANPALQTLFETVELPLESVLADMEYCGIRIDTDYLNQLSRELAEQLQQIEQAAFEAAGEQFNLDSPKQLSALLFERLNLDRRKARKTKTGRSTDHATLERLQGDHPVIDAILRYRSLAKLKSTYIDTLPSLADPQTQRVYADFNQTITTTGRLSSSNPNLQNIPVRTEFSRQIRKAFVPAPGWLLVSADYSQIELRILAHFSQDPILVEAYRNNRDVHTVTAQLLFDKEPGEVTAEERRLGKVINFGVIYGMGAQRFAREAGVSAERGQAFIDRYRERYPQVFAFLDGCKQAAIARGYVETVLGRQRYFDWRGDRLRQLRGAAEETIDLAALRPAREDAETLRAAANAPIQGSSADIIKVAMVQLSDWLQAHQYRARLLLQVHDELVLEVPREEWAELQPHIQAIMEGAVELSVPLSVEACAGPNWLEAK